MQDKDFYKITLHDVELREDQADFGIFRHILANVLDQVLDRLLAIFAFDIGLNFGSIFVDSANVSKTLHGEHYLIPKVSFLEFVVLVDSKFKVLLVTKFSAIIFLNHLWRVFYNKSQIQLINQFTRATKAMILT